MYTLLEGNADGNDIVNILDFSTMVPTFLKSLGQDGYNASADFDRNDIVNIFDFSAMVPNFLVSSPIEVP
jgi:hypothetical protein